MSVEMKIDMHSGEDHDMTEVTAACNIDMSYEACERDVGIYGVWGASVMIESIRIGCLEINRKDLEALLTTPGTMPDQKGFPEIAVYERDLSDRLAAYADGSGFELGAEPDEIAKSFSAYSDCLEASPIVRAA